MDKKKEKPPLVPHPPQQPETGWPGPGQVVTFEDYDRAVRYLQDRAFKTARKEP